MQIFSNHSKKYVSEPGFQFEKIMRERNNPELKELRALKANRKKRLEEKKLDNSI